MASVACAKSSIPQNELKAHEIQNDVERRIFLEHMVLKLLFEEYLMEPCQKTFFRFICAINMGRNELPIVQIHDDHVKDCPLAQALVLKYANGNTYFSPKGLKWTGDRVDELLNDTNFRAAFCLGESVLVDQSKHNHGRHIKELYLFKATDDMLARLGVSAETCSAWQLQYLKYNPYFKMEKVTKDGETTIELKFKSGFNETKPGTWTKGSGAEFVRTFVTSLEGNLDFSRYGDTAVVEHSKYFSDVLHSSYGLNSSSVTVPFTQEEREERKIYSMDRNGQVRPPYKMDADGNVVPLHLTEVTDFRKCSGVGAFYTKRDANGMSALVKDEDRYFGPPIGPELEDSPLLVFGVDILEWVDQKLKETGFKNKQKLANVQRMVHVLQREGVDPIDKIKMGFADFPEVKSSSDNSSAEPKAKKSRN